MGSASVKNHPTSAADLDRIVERRLTIVLVA
jgi:hypothetical protein